MKHPRLALALLLVGLVLSYGWHWVPDELVADVWNIATSALVVFLLSILAMTFHSPEVWLVVALLIVLKLMVIGCSLWYLVDPWPINPGDGMCAARLNVPVGALGLAVAALLAAYIAGGKP